MGGKGFVDFSKNNAKQRLENDGRESISKVM